MPKKNQIDFTRSSRKKEQRFDRFLNWAIVIVVVCILVIGGYLLYSILNTPEKPAANSNHQKVSSSNDDKASKDTSKKKDDTDQATTDDSNNGDGQSSQDGDSSSDTTNQNDDTATTDNSDSGNYDTADGGPSGPWHPIGTVQSEPHQTNYDMGSTDWNERVKAMSYATGIQVSDMTVKWLGNGGSADKSLGKVYSKQDPSKIYDVLMQWVTDKGWQPISVNVE